MKFEQITKGSIALALSNLVPLIGVLLGYWSAFDVIFLYWFENIIIGLFAFCRMTIRPDNSALFAIGGLFTAGFFCLHYGFFTYGHGVFVASFFEDQLIGSNNAVGDGLVDVVGFMLSNRGVQLTLLAMFIAHLIEFIIAYKERKIDAIPAEMFKPYKRIIVLHIAIIFGGFIATKFENTIGVAIVMIALKTYFDLKPPKFTSRRKSSNKQNLSDQQAKDQIRQTLQNPEITVNGKTYKFNSVEEMVNSDQYKKYSKWAKWLMPKSKLAMYEEVLQETIEEERRLAGANESPAIKPNKDL